MVKLIIVLFFMLSCNNEVSSFEKLSKRINKSQKEVVEKTIDQDQKVAYKELTKYSKKIETELFFNLSKSNKVKVDTLSEFKIVNSYSFGSGRNSGLIWNDDFMFVFYYDFKKGKVYVEEYNRDFSNYRNGANVHKKLILFLDLLNDREDLKDMPVLGRSNAAYYIFSRIVQPESGDYLIDSFAFKEL